MRKPAMPAGPMIFFQTKVRTSVRRVLKSLSGGSTSRRWGGLIYSTLMGRHVFVPTSGRNRLGSTPARFAAASTRPSSSDRRVHLAPLGRTHLFDLNGAPRLRAHVRTEPLGIHARTLRGGLHEAVEFRSEGPPRAAGEDSSIRP